jgi:hypothetical protein
MKDRLVWLLLAAPPETWDSKKHITSSKLSFFKGAKLMINTYLR